MNSGTFNQLWKRAHRDYRSRTQDGRRAVLTMDDDGVTVLVVESKKS